MNLSSSRGRFMPPDQTAVEGATSDIASSPIFVEMDNVTLIYGSGNEQTSAIERISLSVTNGEFISVVGPSGCGKSTLMRLITGLILPTEGEIRVSGEAVTGPVKGVGMAFQNATLLPWRTNLGNILLSFELAAPHKHRFRQGREEYLARAQRLLNVVGLGEFGNKYPWQLSGGMQQRVSLCRAIAHEPALLMLDEPFAALDAFTREEMWTIMQALWLEKKFTAILVTHELREAVFLADRVIVMSQRPGRVICDRPIKLPRPRTIEMTFAPDFVDIVHELRGHIHHGLTAAHYGTTT
jgi:NitT/TauT family transport system ATP-binding protein